MGNFAEIFRKAGAITTPREGLNGELNRIKNNDKMRFIPAVEHNHVHKGKQ